MCSLAPPPMLPGEIMDKIVDAIAFEEDLDTLRCCLLVSAAFRLRALYNMLARLDFSPDYGRDHLLKAQGLVQLLESTPALGPMPQSIAVDWSDCVEAQGLWAALARRIVSLLPRLPRLANLTLSNVDVDGTRLLASALPELSAVTSLRLEQCNSTAPDIDALIRQFPNLRSLDIEECHIELPESYAPAALPFAGACELALAATPSSIDWARHHSAVFVLAGLASTPSAAAHELVAEHAAEVRSLTLCMEDNTCKSDEEHAAASVAMCSSLDKLQVIAPSVPHAFVLFRSVCAVAPTCGSLDVRLGPCSLPASEPELNELRAIFTRPVWSKVDTFLLDGDIFTLVAPPKVQIDAATIALPASPVLAPVDCKDDLDLDDLDDVESVADSESESIIPALSEASSDASDSDSEDEFDQPVRRAFAPPFALGVSITKSREHHIEYDDEPTPMPHQAVFHLNHDEEDEDGSLHIATAVSSTLNPFAPPFVLGMSTQRTPQ